MAKGREKDLVQTQELANGRVWSGEAALDLGLVDQLGGLEDAVGRAAALAQLEQWQVRRRLPPTDPRAELMAALSQVSQSGISPMVNQNSALQALLREVAAPYLGPNLRAINGFNDPKYLNVFCLECLLPSYTLGDLYLAQ